MRNTLNNLKGYNNRLLLEHTGLLEEGFWGNTIDNAKSFGYGVKNGYNRQNSNNKILDLEKNEKSEENDKKKNEVLNKRKEHVTKYKENMKGKSISGKKLSHIGDSVGYLAKPLGKLGLGAAAAYGVHDVANKFYDDYTGIDGD